LRSNSPRPGPPERLGSQTLADTKQAADQLFASGEARQGSFRFDEKVVQVFPDMIARSVPGYELIVPMIGLLARRYARPDTRIYDLGCSLGACTLAMRAAVTAERVAYVAVDNAPAMIEACRERLVASGDAPLELVCKDLRALAIENASVVVMNFTLQFVAPAERAALMRRIAQGMVPGGVLILAEKVRFENALSQRDQTDWHHEFKRAMGYSDLEIAAKRTALEHVLQPDTHEQHEQRLLAAGFERVERWFQCFSFQALIAFR
jgi:tRNA (cmo5U34)-methyltransferase